MMVNISDLDLNLLLVFEALVEERSVSGAARRLHRTQPALSNALNRLRDALGDALFVRVGHAMQPTPRAEELAPGVLSALQSLRATFEHKARFDPATSQRVFRITTSDYGTFVLLPRLMPLVQARAPGINLRIVTAESKSHERERVLSGDVDLALGVYDVDTASLRAERLLHERFVVLAREGHPGIKKRLGRQAFIRYPHVLIASSGDDRSIIDARLAEAGEHRQVALTVPHFAAAVFIVAETDCIITLAERVARRLARAANVQVLPCPVTLHGFWLSMLWNHRLHTDPAHMWLRDTVREAARRLVSE